MEVTKEAMKVKVSVVLAKENVDYILRLKAQYGSSFGFTINKAIELLRDKNNTTKAEIVA